MTSFAQITSDVEVQRTLQQLYGSVNNIDLWVGALAEDHVRGGSVGPLIERVLVDQFQRLRDGDRFWYQRAFSGTQLAKVEQTKLSDIIERNTGVNSLQDNVFFKADVQGQIFFDTNANGRRDGRESALANITVELLDDEGEVVATTQTGRDGRYRLDQFGETGDYAVRVVLPSAMRLTTGGEFEFLVRSGDATIKAKDFGLAPVRSAGALVANSTASETWQTSVDRLFASQSDDLIPLFREFEA